MLQLKRIFGDSKEWRCHCFSLSGLNLHKQVFTRLNFPIGGDRLSCQYGLSRTYKWSHLHSCNHQPCRSHLLILQLFHFRLVATCLSALVLFWRLDLPSFILLGLLSGIQHHVWVFQLVLEMQQKLNTYFCVIVYFKFWAECVILICTHCLELME